MGCDFQRSKKNHKDCITDTTKEIVSVHVLEVFFKIIYTIQISLKKNAPSSSPRYQNKHSQKLREQSGAQMCIHTKRQSKDHS